MTLLVNTSEPTSQPGAFPQNSDDSTAVMVRVMVPVRRANRFWQMLRDESTSEFTPFGTYESDDFPSHRLMVAELAGKPKDVNVDLEMFNKYHFKATVVDSDSDAVSIPNISFKKTNKLDFNDPDMDFNKKAAAATSAFS